MSDLTAFLITFGAAAIVAAIVNLPKMGRLRRGLDRRNTLNTDLQLARLATRAGSDGHVVQTGFGDRHRATIGLKLTATALVTLLLWTLFSMGSSGQMNAMGDARSPKISFDGWSTTELSLLGLVVLWYLLFVWTYEIKLGRDDVSVPTILFGSRILPLDDLVAVESDRAYILRLFFASHRRAEIFQFVTGASQLRAALETRAAQNGDRNAGTSRGRNGQAGSRARP
ncbi:hypothetical protein AADZ90_002950 [Aestuariibius sp. 2305UL40-4]|uniref:hypothetical protein n=1 Tax=Aestuariibius violaceus TaxID=3234132 RepID=UPI00345E5628